MSISGTTFDEESGAMDLDNDFTLAQLIAEKLKGKFWQVTAGEWWVVVEGISRQRLVILTNDPFGVSFSPQELTIGLKDIRDRSLLHLQQAGLICEDGSWALPIAS